MAFQAVVREGTEVHPLRDSASPVAWCAAESHRTTPREGLKTKLEAILATEGGAFLLSEVTKGGAGAVVQAVRCLPCVC